MRTKKNCYQFGGAWPMLCKNNTAGLQPIRKKHNTFVSVQVIGKSIIQLFVFTHDYKLPSMLFSEKHIQEHTPVKCPHAQL